MQNRELINCELDIYSFLHSRYPSDPEPRRTGPKKEAVQTAFRTATALWSGTA